MDDDNEINVVIEQTPYFDGDDEVIEVTRVFVNGEEIPTNGNYLQSVLEYLGYIATVEYY